MLTVHKLSLFVVLTICLLTVGCNTAKEIGRTLGDLAVVRAEVIKKFGEKDVNVNVNTFQDQMRISVMFVNSPLNDASKEERTKRSQETVEIVKQHYPAIKNVSEIWIGFLRVTTRMVVFHYSEMLDAYPFNNEGRPLLDPRTPPVEPDQPSVRYMPNQKAAEISSSGIQLEGTEEKGVTLFPHFLVATDAEKAPDEVSLDFAAFSDKPKFPDVTKIVFIADKEMVYSTEGQFSTSKIAGDMYSEFLYLKIPTAAFLKISSGRVVKIKLNKNQYTLTEKQIVSMQRMSKYLTNASL